VSVTDGIIDDRSSHGSRASIGTSWTLLTDTVMGGVSRGGLEATTIDGRPALRMTGLVRLENDGGFIQMALDLSPDGGPVDASPWTGIELDLQGNGEAYGLHLRTTAVTRPWQSYRQTFIAPARWTTLRLPFAGFTPHRLDTPLDPRQLRRLGLVAIGRAFAADLAMGGLRFYGRTG
jgi:hypothetical protein